MSAIQGFLGSVPAPQDRFGIPLDIQRGQFSLDVKKPENGLQMGSRDNKSQKC